MKELNKFSFFCYLSKYLYILAICDENNLQI